MIEYQVIETVMKTMTTQICGGSHNHLITQRAVDPIVGGVVVVNNLHVN